MICVYLRSSASHSSYSVARHAAALPGGQTAGRHRLHLKGNDARPPHAEILQATAGSAYRIIRMKEKYPPSIDHLRKHHPGIFEAFQNLAEKCHETGGPLDEKSRRLAKLGIAIGFRHEGAVHSAVRHALDAGISQEEIFHVAILGITTIGWPASYAAVTWIRDAVERQSENTG